MRRIYLVYVVILIHIFGCKEEGKVDQIDGTAPAPSSVLVQSVENKPGGAIIHYRIPDDNNLLGVKVVYSRNGEICESKASRYVDTLVVEGFGSAELQEVSLYSIGHNGKLSAPVKTTINPLTPPVESVQFDIVSSFGGVIIDLQENHSNADLAVVLMGDTTSLTLSKEKLVDIQTFHTKSTAIKISRRGLADQPTHFGVYLRDRWNNVSDTIYRTLTPIAEMKLPKTGFRNAALPTDYFSPAEGVYGFRLEQLWTGAEAADGNFFASSFSGPMPQWFTIDLGGKMSISRIQKWPRGGYELYSGSAPRVIQVWGSDHPNPDGSWDDSWSLLGEFEQFKPSGYGEAREVGPITAEDTDYWNNRTEFELVPTDDAPDPYRPVTHLRVKILSTFTTYGTDNVNGQVIIGEMTFWGQLID